MVTSALACIQRCWRRAASYSRAFSTATPAAAPSATSTASSSSVNAAPPRLLVRYRLPNTSSRTRTGTPRKPRIGGCPSGKPDDARWAAMSARRSGRGSSISRPSRPRPSGQWWIRAISSWDRPTGMNSARLLPSPMTPSAPYVASTRPTAVSTIRRSVDSRSRPEPMATTASSRPRIRSLVASTTCSLPCSSARSSSSCSCGSSSGRFSAPGSISFGLPDGDTSQGYLALVRLARCAWSVT